MKQKTLFGISRNIDVMSDGSKTDEYMLYQVNDSGNIPDLSYDDLVLLHQFLTDYLKVEKGGSNE